MSERNYVFLGILLFIIGVLLFIYDIISNEFSVRGIEYARLEQQIKEYTEQNQKLKIELWDARSYNTIQQKAREEGLTQDAKFYILY